MEQNLEKELIRYFKSLGLDVNTNTKARGHQGFFMKNRIDVSKYAEHDKKVQTLLHEFAHYINSRLEDKIERTGGSFEKIFDLDIYEKEVKKSQIFNELIAVTHFVDDSSKCQKLLMHKEQTKAQIKRFEEEIKKDYPNFMRSKKFKDFDKYIKKSKAKYLLKYDRVKFITPFLRREEIFSIKTVETDFPDMPKAFVNCIKLKSVQRKQARISRRINNYKKYYSKPTELFARFIEGLYINFDKTKELAPTVCDKFFNLLNEGYYYELKNVLDMVGVKENNYFLQESLI